jgi:hypothetical protein
MPNCSNCGKPVAEGAPFCLSCGAPQGVVAAGPAEPAAPPVYGAPAQPPAYGEPTSTPPQAPTYGAPAQPPPQGPPPAWPSPPVGSAPPPDQVPPPVYTPALYGTAPAGAAPQAYAPPAGPAAAGVAPAAAKRGLPGWAIALIIIGVVLLVAIPVVLVVAPFFFVGNIVEDVAPIINEQIEIARENSVRDGVTTIQAGVEAWAADHDGTYPSAARVSAQRLVAADGTAYVDVWPSNPFSGGSMTQGNGAGRFLYDRGPGGASYSITGYGEDGTILITVP